MRSDPKISIIMPTFNSGATVERAILSCIHQVPNRFELIIIDGASTDDTLKIIRQYEPHITYWLSEEDSGLYNAMNKGVNRATGEWLYFLGSDDILTENVLEQTLPFLIPECSIVYGYVEYDNGKRMVSNFSQRMLLENTLHHQSAFYNRRLFESFRYDEDLRVVADYELNLRAYLLGVSVKYINRQIAVCGSGGVSSDLSSNEINKVRSKYIKNVLSKAVLNKTLDVYYAYHRFKLNVKNRIVERFTEKKGTNL